MRLALAAVAAVAVMTPGAVAGSSASAPVIVRKDATFGRVLLTRGHKPLYYWGVEKQARKIVCTGSCLALWPPLIVKSRAAVAKKVAGARGTFGVVKRPDGRLQVAYNGLALYAYVHDGPDKVLCDNVDRWFVVRV
jgi:predicted lipoprotein with Yx(FWY)xxD motif